MYVWVILSHIISIFNLGIDYEGMYNMFVETLKKTYAKLFAHYNKMNSRCILEKQKKTFKKYLVNK